MLSLFKGVVAEYTKIHKEYSVQIEEPCQVRIRGNTVANLVMHESRGKKRVS